MSFPYQSDPVLPTDTYCIIAQVTKHLQRASPSVPYATILRMAEGFELHIRARATSRQDYVNRVNAGLMILLDPARHGTMPDLMHDTTTGQGFASPATLEVNPPGGSVYHSSIPTPQVMANGQHPYSALAPTIPPNVDYGPPTMGTADVPIAANVDLSVQQLDIDLVTSTAPNVPQMDAHTASTHVSPATGENASRIPSTAPISGQQYHVTAATSVAEPADQHKNATQNDGPDQEQNIEKKETPPPPEPEQAKSTVRTTRRTSRAQSTRQSKKASPAASKGQTATTPTTRSRARRNTKRPTRKRSTRGRKRAVKPSENPEPLPVENDNEKSSALQNTQPGQACSREEAPELSRADGTGVQELKHKRNVVFQIAQEHINQNRNAAIRNSTTASPTLGPGPGPGPLPSSISGLPSAMSSIPTPSTTGPVISPAAAGLCHDAGTHEASIRPNLAQAPGQGAARPSTASSDPNISRRPFRLGASAQRAQATGENVRFCSNGEVEIDDGIRVSKERIVVAAATLGIMLTPSQLHCMKRVQALMILVKASQHEMVQTNGMMHFLGTNPILAQQTAEEERRHFAHPGMAQAVHSQSNLGSTHPDLVSSATQPSNQTGLPLNSKEQGDPSRHGISLTRDPGLSAQPCSSTAQTSVPAWIFASNVLAVQSRLRKFQMDYRKYLSLIQQELLGRRARTSDQFLRYLRCCINLLAMNPTQVRGVSVEVIDSIEKFLRHFLSQYSNLTRSKSGQPSQPVPVNTQAETSAVPMSCLNTSDFDPSVLQNALPSTPQPVTENSQRSDPLEETNSTPIHSSPFEHILVPSQIPNGAYANTAVGATNSVHVNASAHQVDNRTGADLDQITPNDPVHDDIIPNGPDQTTLSDGELQNASEPNGRKRKNSPNCDSEKSGKRLATRMTNGLSDAVMREGESGSPNRDRIHAIVESSKQVSPAELIDITDEMRPPVGVAVYCQRDTNGNMFNLVRLSDRPDLGEVLQRLRFMLNCAMKLTTCYISVSEGREEDNSRRLEEVVVSLEPKKVTSGSDKGEAQDASVGTSLSLVELIKAECAEARKRYGSLTVQMMEEFRRPVFRGILRYNERPFPKLELRVAGGRKGEPEVRGYERPPMGWVGVLEQVRKLFCSSIEGGKGVEEMVRRWIRTREDFNGWMELRERAEDE